MCLGNGESHLAKLVKRKESSGELKLEKSPGRAHDGVEDLSKI